MKIYKSELESRAIKISSTLSEFYSGGNRFHNRGPGGGLGSYFRFLDDIAMTDVWIVDGVIDNPDQVNEYMGQVLVESIHLQRLVNDLLDLVKLQNTEFTVEMILLDLADVLQEVVRSMTIIAEKKGILISISCKTENHMILGDYNRIRQVMIILLDKAIKFSYDNRCVLIEIMSNKQGNIIFSIENTGVEISKNDLRTFLIDLIKLRAKTIQMVQGWDWQ